ncbi:MAG: hypothetical protein ACT4O1_04960 [Gemmatimonadota bacterium]
MFARTRCRSFCFLEHAGEPWTAFLVTYAENDTHWKGHFMFRSALMAPDSGEVRTADLFVEDSEAAIDARARGLGRPLLEALLQSALHTQQSKRGVPGEYVRWFRDLLSKHAAHLSSERSNDPARSMQQLKQLYDSYRTDQVSHLIALIEPDAFRHVVDKLLAGREIDFRARDRFQLAMTVVQELERRLRLPPFEAWAEDYLAHREEYERYTEKLHLGEMP